MGVYLVKVGSSGEKIWENHVVGYREYQPMWVSETDSDGLVVVGTSRAEGTVGSDMFMIRVDGKGDKVWETHITGSAPKMISQSSDGSIFVAKSRYIYKFNESGHQEWMKSYDGSFDGVQPYLEGGFLVSGSVLRVGGDRDAQLALMDNFGGMVWNYVFESPESMGALCLSPLKNHENHGYVLAIVGLGEDFTRNSYTLTRINVPESITQVVLILLTLLIIPLTRRKIRTKRVDIHGPYTYTNSR